MSAASLDVDPLSWGQEHVVEWLVDRGLPEEIVATFEAHLVNGMVAATLSEDDLAAMGILHPLHQRRVLCELRQLFAPVLVAMPSTPFHAAEDFSYSGPVLMPGLHTPDLGPPLGSRPTSAHSSRAALGARQRSSSPRAMEVRALARAGLLPPQLGAPPSPLPESPQQHQRITHSPSAPALRWGGTSPVAAVAAALRKVASTHCSVEAFSPPSSPLASSLSCRSPRLPSKSPPRQRRPGSAYGSTASRGPAWQQSLRMSSLEPSPSKRPWSPPKHRPSRADDWLPKPKPSDMAPASLVGVPASASMDPMQLAGEIAALRMSCEEGALRSCPSSYSEISGMLENFDPRVQACSARLASVSRERNALRDEISLAQRHFEAKTVERDRRLNKMSSERNELRQQLRASQKHCGAQSRECERLRSRLAQALAWCAGDHDEGGAPDADHKHPGRSTSSGGNLRRPAAGAGADRMDHAAKQVVFESPSVAPGCEPIRLSAALGVRTATSAGVASEPLAYAAEPMAVPRAGPQELRPGGSAPGRPRVGALGPKSRRTAI